MKKSTDESPENNTPAAPQPRQQELLVEVFFSEGGFSLLVIFPIVVIYFLSMALESV